MLKRHKFDIVFRAFFIMAIIWNITGSDSFTYFWIFSGFVLIVFLLYFHITEERE